MLAVPVFRARVAPVLNYCSKILVFPADMHDTACGREITFLNPNPFDLLRILHKEGVGTLICGALSPEVLSFGEHLGMRIIHGVAGEIGEVLHAYREKRLDQPSFRLPGCCAQGDGYPGETTGFCLCPFCGRRARHGRKTPCTQIRCSKCNEPMVPE
jgi:predicted Fe-Mo cluster-binding NifX family protein